MAENTEAKHALTTKWVFGAASLAIAIISFALLERPVESEASDQKPSLSTAAAPTLSCFESSTATIRVRTEGDCSSELISLGNAPLEQLFERSETNRESITTQVHPLLQARFFAAATAAEREGVRLYISSSFRSLDRQALLFQRAVAKYGSEREAAKWVLPAEFSNHPKGLALDVNYPSDRDGADWLDRNGSRFGLCLVYANEWWHFEGVIAPGQLCPPPAPNALVDTR